MLKRILKGAAALTCAASLLLGGGCASAAIYSFEAEGDLSMEFTNDDEFYYYGDASLFAAKTTSPMKLEKPELIMDVAVTGTTAVLLTANGLYASGTIADLPFGDASTLNTDGIVRFVYSEREDIPERGQRYVPVDLSDAQQIASGSNFTLVRTKDGRVYGWGSNSWGQLGVSSGEMYSTNTPVRIGELEGIALIATSNSTGLCAAIDMDGHVWTWGYGHDIKKLDIELAVHVVCGEGFLAVLDNGGKVWFWIPGPGGNGVWHYASEPTPTGYEKPAIIDTLPDIFSIAAGDGFLAAMDGEGNVWTMGINDEGQLGRPSEDPNRADLVPAKVEGLSDVISISAGRAHMMAMTKNMTIYLWGSNSSGQLGKTGIAYSETPVEAPLVRMKLAGY